MSYVCPECLRPCRFIEVDFGIGAYEYWGARGVDVRLAVVSDCCEADPPDELFSELCEEG